MNIKKFTKKNAVTLTTQKSPLAISFILSHTHIGLRSLRGLIWIPDQHPRDFYIGVVPQGSVRWLRRYSIINQLSAQPKGWIASYESVPRTRVIFAWYDTTLLFRREHLTRVNRPEWDINLCGAHARKLEKIARALRSYACVSASYKCNSTPLELEEDDQKSYPRKLLVPISLFL